MGGSGKRSLPMARQSYGRPSAGFEDFACRCHPDKSRQNPPLYVGRTRGGPFVGFEIDRQGKHGVYLLAVAHQVLVRQAACRAAAGQELFVVPRLSCEQPTADGSTPFSVSHQESMVQGRVEFSLDDKCAREADPAPARVFPPLHIISEGGPQCTRARGEFPT
jgi:hypothetical protein